MRTIFRILSCVIFLASSSHALAQCDRRHTICPGDRVTVRFLVGDGPSTTITLNCDPQRQECRGEGTFHISGEPVPVIIEADFQPGGLILRVKTARESLGSDGMDFFYMPTGRASKQTRDFKLYRVPDWGAIRTQTGTDRPLTPSPLVYRFGDKIPGTLRIIFERDADRRGTPPYSTVQ